MSALGQPCPQGFFCAGGSATPVPCQAAPGYVCAGGAVATQGTQCPAGFFCAGGGSDKVACTVMAGYYCPRCHPGARSPL